MFVGMHENGSPWSLIDPTPLRVKRAAWRAVELYTLAEAGWGFLKGLGEGFWGRAASSGAENAASFAKYKDALRAAMSKAAVSNPELESMMGNLYREGATVGSGSTAAAVRQELATGASVGGRLHSQKAGDAVVFLRRWLARNPAASAGDRAAAEDVIRDLENALHGH